VGFFFFEYGFAFGIGRGGKGSQASICERTSTAERVELDLPRGLWPRCHFVRVNRINKGASNSLLPATSSSSRQSSSSNFKILSPPQVAPLGLRRLVESDYRSGVHLVFSRDCPQPARSRQEGGVIRAE
jgi:hypothetical protein